jgi:hypothetical protein
MSKSLNQEEITVVHPNSAASPLDDPNRGFADDNNWWDTGRRDAGVDDTD